MPVPATDYIVRPNDSVRHVMGVIDRTRGGVALVVDEAGRLQGTITDGNIRRYVLGSGDLAAACSSLLEKKPITAPATTSRGHLQQLMQQHRLLHLPTTDTEGRPSELWSLRDFVAPAQATPVVAVIMAGGEGKRLRPLTETIPKPMVELRGEPLLAHIIRNLRAAQISTVYVAVNYRAEVIENYFGDGQRFGVDLHYLREPKKMGTAGALTLLPQPVLGPLLVINGDVVTDVPYERLLDWHFEHHAALTVAAVEYTTQVPYGVLACEGHRVVGITEKPEHTFFCGAGMYVLEPTVLDLLPAETVFDMNQVITAAVAAQLAVSAFPLHEQWFDIGRQEDLERATIKMETVL